MAQPRISGDHHSSPFVCSMVVRSARILPCNLLSHLGMPSMQPCYLRAISIFATFVCVSTWRSSTVACERPISSRPTIAAPITTPFAAVRGCAAQSPTRIEGDGWVRQEASKFVRKCPTRVAQGLPKVPVTLSMCGTIMEFVCAHPVKQQHRWSSGQAQKVQGTTCRNEVVILASGPLALNPSLAGAPSCRKCLHLISQFPVAGPNCPKLLGCSTCSLLFFWGPSGVRSGACSSNEPIRPAERGAPQAPSFAPFSHPILVSRRWLALSSRCLVPLTRPPRTPSFPFPPCLSFSSPHRRVSVCLPPCFQGPPQQRSVGD